jgi:two-component system cell cycle sensor histidine kinase/response regulator CckA
MTNEESLQRDARLAFLEAMVRVDAAIRGANDLEQMVRNVLDVTQAIFRCDRVGLDHARADNAEAFRVLLDSSRPVRFGPDEQPLPTAASVLGARSVLAMALRPKATAPYVIAIGQDQPRVFTPCEEELFAEIGHRLADAASNLHTLRSLRESEARFAEAQVVAHLGYWENDVVADRIFWSDETYRILGIERSEHAPNAAAFRERIHPDDRWIQAAASARALSGESRYDLVYRVVRPDGEVRTIHSVGDVVNDASGRPYRGFGVVQDITERRRAEEELALFRSLLDHTKDAIEIIDAATGRFLDVNERACAAHGYTRDEYLALEVHHLDPVAGREPWQKTYDQLRALGSRVFESEHRRKDGSVFPVEVNVTFIRRDREYFLAIVRDITQRKLVEEQLRQAQKMEAVGRLAGGVAHDFNNLLTVINSTAELMMEALGPDDPSQELLDDVLSAGMRGVSLTRQLLAFSRKQKLEPQVVDLNGVLERLVHLLRRVIGEHIELRLRPSAKLGRVKVDPAQFEQVILNLAVNARDAMPGGGSLTIETRDVEIDARDAVHLTGVRPGRYVCVIVEDSGHGIDEASKARIFEPFFTTKEPGRGTGLGLAMAYGFVKQSGGHMELRSEVGRGTTFLIHLPHTDQAIASPRQAVGLSPVGGGTETILLVEDEEVVRKVAKRMLQSRGYEVLDASDGQHAVSVYREHQGAVDILVTDVVMPRMGGRELAELLVLERPELPVLLVSGYTDGTAMSPPSEGTATSRVDFLQKPFRSVDLARSVRALLDA